MANRFKYILGVGNPADISLRISDEEQPLSVIVPLDFLVKIGS